MIKVVIGSMVLCHLLVPNPTSQNVNSENEPIVKVLGQVVDMQKGSRYIEKVDDKQALRVDRDILIIKGQNREGLYQVDSRACMLVRDETPEERENRLFPKVKVEEPASEEKVELTEEVLQESNKVEQNAGIEIQNKPAIDEEQLMPKEDLKVEATQEVKKTEPTPEPVKEVVQEEKKEVKAEPVVKKEEKVEEKKTDKKSLLDYIK